MSHVSPIDGLCSPVEWEQFSLEGGRGKCKRSPEGTDVYCARSKALCVGLLVGPLADRAKRMRVYVVFSEFLSLTDCLVGESVSKLASAVGLCGCVH